MRENLTTGSVGRNVILFSLPYLLSYFLQTLYGMADLFIIGQFEGVASTTAVSIGSQVMHMITVMIVGLAMGTTVCIGQAVGGGSRDRVAQTVGNTVTLFMVLSVAAAGLMFVWIRPIVSVMSTPEEAVEGTAAYLTICFLGIPFITAYNIISSIFRGMGDSKSPMYFVAVACAANIALDYLFMGAFHLGPAGAALGNELRAAELEELFYEEGFVFRRSGSLPKLDPNGDDIAAVLQSEVDFLGLETAYDTAIFDGADFSDADYSDLMSRADIFKDEVDEALSEMVAI